MRVLSGCMAHSDQVDKSLRRTDASMLIMELASPGTPWGLLYCACRAEKDTRDDTKKTYDKTCFEGIASMGIVDN